VNTNSVLGSFTQAHTAAFFFSVEKDQVQPVLMIKILWGNIQSIDLYPTKSDTDTTHVANKCLPGTILFALKTVLYFAFRARDSLEISRGVKSSASVRKRLDWPPRGLGVSTDTSSSLCSSGILVHSSSKNCT